MGHFAVTNLGVQFSDRSVTVFWIEGIGSARITLTSPTRCECARMTFAPLYNIIRLHDTHAPSAQAIPNRRMGK